MSRRSSVSVIIPTLNRSRVLCETLESLLSVMPQDGSAEVLVVDQSSAVEPDDAALLDEWMRVGKIQYHRVAFRGTTKARNFGVAHAQGDVIIYIDDDVLTPPGFVEAHLRAYEDGSLAGVAGGVQHEGERLVDREALSWRQRISLRAGSLVLFNATFPYRIKWARGCNMSFRREWIIRAGGFDENFYGVAVGEEPEFCYRLRKAGGTLRFVPETRLFHRAVVSGGSRDEARERENFIAFVDNAWYYRLCVEPRWLMRLVHLVRLAFSLVKNRRFLTSNHWPANTSWILIAIAQAFRRFSKRELPSLHA